MKAAVLHAIGQTPRFEEFSDPIAREGEAIVHVRAASLKNVDKAIASGAHYQRAAALPCVCGLDGVGLLDDGTRVYCGGPRAPFGMMAERAVVSRGWCLPVPPAVDDLTAAALPNPTVSAWLALTWRARLSAGESVLVLGATGVAGQIAVQLAKHLGAGRIVAAGRNAAVLATLPSLGADATIHLGAPDDDVAAALGAELAVARFDVVLDYLWGRPMEQVIEALTRHDLAAEASRTRVIQIGEMAGASIALGAGALRSSGIEIYGSGGGSVPHDEIFRSFSTMWKLAAEGTLRVGTEAVPLARVEDAWRRPGADGRRIVIVP